MRVEPPPSQWAFPPLDDADPEGPVAVGADLAPATLLAAYRHGLFPMPVGRRNRVGWWSPDPRAVLPLDRFHLTRSTRRSARDFTLTIDARFEEVVRRCGDPRRPHGWINEEITAAYVELHRLGWAHSVETWRGDELVGGLYGVSIGSFFAGESMFHSATDASKVALAHLVELLAAAPDALLDVQWLTPHLESLGAVEIPRADYLRLLHRALAQPHVAFDDPQWQAVATGGPAPSSTGGPDELPPRGPGHT